MFVAFKETDSIEFAILHLVFADRRATARTTTFVEPCSIQPKKKAEDQTLTLFSHLITPVPSMGKMLQVVPTSESVCWSSSRVVCFARQRHKD